MPFTPFHFGPGALVKSAFPRWFSLRAFLITQVVIDCEAAWNIARGHERLHTFFHSYLGVSVAMALVGVLLIAYNWVALQLPDSWLVRELDDWGEPFQLRSSGTGILIGGWSHVFLDSLMHEDMRPLSPLTDANGALNLISVEALHLACLWSFAAAGMVWALRWILRRAFFRRFR